MLEDGDFKAALPNENGDWEDNCPYCGGNCPNDHDHACDGFLGDWDGAWGDITEAQEWSDYDSEC
jgi:hypothetical protein